MRRAAELRSAALENLLDAGLSVADAAHGVGRVAVELIERKTGGARFRLDQVRDALHDIESSLREYDNLMAAARDAARREEDDDGQV